MKKLLITIVCILTCTLAGAQEIILESSTPQEIMDRYKVKSFEVAVGAGFGASSFHFPKSQINTEGRAGFSGSLMAQYNNSKLGMGLRTGISYEWIRSYYPDQADIFGSTLGYKQTSIDIPLSVVFFSGNQKARFYMGIGPSLSCQLSSSLDGYGYKTNEYLWGMDFFFGFRYKHFFWEEDFITRYSDTFTPSSNAPESRLNTVSFKLGWVF